MKLILTLLFFIIFVTSMAQSKSLIPSSFSTNFEETIVLLASKKEMKSYGKIDYKYPGNIRFEVTSDPKKTFVSNPERSWLYDPPFIPTEMGQVTIQKSNTLPLTKMLDSIRVGLEGSKLFTKTYSGNDLLLAFGPEMQKKSSLKLVTFHASKDAKTIEHLKDFETLILEYTDGRKVNYKFIDMKEDVAFDAKQFVFSVPDKTKVTTN